MKSLLSTERMVPVTDGVSFGGVIVFGERPMSLKKMAPAMSAKPITIAIGVAIDGDEGRSSIQRV